MSTNFSRLFYVLLVTIVLASCNPGVEPEINPFRIGQVIYPNEEYAEEHNAKELALANQGTKVLDISSQLVRVQYSDGSVDVLSFYWFEPAEIELTEKWALGNPFHEGDKVCAVSDSLREGFLDKGIIDGVSGEFVLIKDHDTLLNWGHFQFCQ